MKIKLLAALVSGSLFACGNPSAPLGEDLTASSQDELRAKAKAPAPRHAPAPATYTVQLSETSTNPAFKTTFSVSSTYDLFIAFDLPVALSGQHTAAFEISSPDGAVFQRTEVPFSTGTSTHYRVWSSMPVAGTWIEQFSMTGTWSVKVYVDSDTTARATKAFILQ